MKHIFIYEGGQHNMSSSILEDNGYFREPATLAQLHWGQNDHTTEFKPVRVNLGETNSYQQGRRVEHVVLGEELEVDDYMYVYLGTQGYRYDGFHATCRNILEGWEFEASTVPAEQVAQIVYCTEGDKEQMLSDLAPINGVTVAFTSENGIGREISELELFACANADTPDGNGGFGISPGDFRGNGLSGETPAYGHLSPPYVAGNGQGVYLRIKLVARPDVAVSVCGKCDEAYPIIEARLYWAFMYQTNETSTKCNSCNLKCSCICDQMDCKLDFCEGTDSGITTPEGGITTPEGGITTPAPQRRRVARK